MNKLWQRLYKMFGRVHKSEFYIEDHVRVTFTNLTNFPSGNSRVAIPPIFMGYHVPTRRLCYDESGLGVVENLIEDMHGTFVSVRILDAVTINDRAMGFIDHSGKFPVLVETEDSFRAKLWSDNSVYDISKLFQQDRSINIQETLNYMQL